MQKLPSAIFVVFLTLFVLNTKCAKILVLHPLHGGSHKLQMQVLSKHLIGHGHQVTTLSFQNVGDVTELETNNITNYILTVDNSDGRYPYMTVESQGRFRFPVELLWKSGHNPHYLPLNAFKMTEALCRALLENEQLLGTLRQEKFDLAIVDVISNECGLAFAYQAGISSTIAYWALFPVNGEMDYIGSFLPPSFVPTFLSQLSERMSFMERLYNTYLRLGGSLVMEFQFHLTHKYIQEYFPKTPHPKELIANLSGVLINSDFSLDYPKLLPPNAVNVGCMQCRDPLPLPKDLEDFMESSGEFGVVIFSMGASFDAAVAKNLVPKLFDAFSRLQQNVLVKIGTQAFFNVPSNVKLVQWFPQQDVLGK
ncbi:unnamed protein product [Allacma fusca]|uniref:Glucuronosyltransferase n=1 Tax=Allacma fusca TaxID=39272 RepID=A0A8J2KH11_9HEXA|nr:unnamed protein product [Allacma fusca]